MIGLLGAMGSGKSRVASIFEKLGCGIIDADKISHELLERQEIKHQVVDIFGSDILGPLQQIDRQKLGRLVFEDKKNLEKLTEILHPEVYRNVGLKIRLFQDNTDIRAIVLDIPLLIETGRQSLCDVLVYVEINEAIRRERLEKTRNLDAVEQKKRENFQISLDKKKEIANFTIDNNSDVSDLERQVEKIFSAIQNRR